MLDPYLQLWTMCGEITHHLPDWMAGPFTDINAEQVSAECDKWGRSSTKLAKITKVSASMPQPISACFADSLHRHGKCRCAQVYRVRGNSSP